MWIAIFLPPAIGLEAFALIRLLGGNQDEVSLVLILALHALASLLAALATIRLVPDRFSRSAQPLVAMFFAANYALPIVGMFATLASIVVLRKLQAPAEGDKHRAVELPPIDIQQRYGGGFRQTGLGNFLNNRLAPVGTRLRALVALQSVPGRVASPILRGVLGDPSEDIRLLAYGMLDNQEKRLNNEIHAARQMYAAAVPGQPVRRAAAMRLSDLYWELVYQALVSGDLHRHACEESLRFAREAIGDQTPDAALALRLGRLLHETGQREAAREAYEQAMALGLPEPRVTPYLAELAFEDRDFDAVRQQMQRLSAWPAQAKVAGPLAYWMDPCGEDR